MLSVKQGGIKYHFLSLWYDLTWDWTPVSWTIGKHSTRSAYAANNIKQILGSTQQNSSCTATYHLSRKLYKSGEPDMQDTDGEERTDTYITYSSVPLRMDEQSQDDQLEAIYNSSVPDTGCSLKDLAGVILFTQPLRSGRIWHKVNF